MDIFLKRKKYKKPITHKTKIIYPFYLGIGQLVKSLFFLKSIYYLIRNLPDCFKETRYLFKERAG